MKKILIIFALIIILFIASTSTGIIIKFGNKKQQEDHNELSEVYNNSKIFMISSAFNSIHSGHIIIDGYHNNSTGYGIDNKIILKYTGKSFYGIGIIYNNLGILDSSPSGWSHSKLQILNFTGWMSGHEKSSGYTRLCGSFDKLILTGYR